MTTIVALRGMSIDSHKADRFEKSADTLQAPASTIKMVTAYTARRWVTDAMLSNTVTVISGDLVGGSTANLMNGDVLTYEDLFYGVLLPSGNDAATCLARNVGQIILDSEGGGGDPTVRFLTEMGVTATLMGWTGCVFIEPTGLDDDNRLCVRYLVYLLCEIAAADPWLRGVMGSLSHVMHIIGGSHVRTYSVYHTIDPNGAVKFPEFVAGKTGTTTGAGACVIMLWTHTDGSQHATGILNSTADSRFPDLRAVMDGVLETTSSGLWTVRDGALTEASVNIVRDGALTEATF